MGGLGVKMGMSLIQAGLVGVVWGQGCPGAVLVGVRLGRTICKGISPEWALWAGGEDFCKQARRPVEGLGPWGKAGSEEEEEEPREGSSGGQDILQEPGAGGLGMPRK